MKYVTETIVLAVGAFIALLGAAFAQDRLFEAHMWVLFFVLLASTLFMIRRISFAPATASTSSEHDDGYCDEVIRYGVIATVFWGVVGFLVGVVVAAQLAFPDLNIEPWLNFLCTPRRSSSPSVATR
jgi:cytochrome c oxidase cbb3-type subunit I